jgi:hypothetical protein
MPFSVKRNGRFGSILLKKAAVAAQREALLLLMLEAVTTDLVSPSA